MQRATFALLFVLLAVCHGDMESYRKRIARKWLTSMEAEEGLQKTSSGLLYKVIKESGKTFSPGPSTPCQVHYHGTLPDGTMFDSSIERGQPATFAPNQVIKGWTEALQMMHVGDKWEVYLEPELAYGARGSPPKIPPHSPLKFEMEIMSCDGDSTKPKKSKKAKKAKKAPEEDL
eukprot:NODE_5583_length_660_cov_48.901800_g5204_i0.p1 GENE.NODE_5583_length_660_cov_48.901800_g5204_i0~~NODE_5583_length_660_cov_48.901800_g5204_i0.p1  ORF type:complete len:191 (+),score=57.85 NODE_5583_length_660_cov_48.901800_g5204_i0:49-573(+)